MLLAQINSFWTSQSLAPSTLADSRLQRLAPFSNSPTTRPIFTHPVGRWGRPVAKRTSGPVMQQAWSPTASSGSGLGSECTPSRSKRQRGPGMGSGMGSGLGSQGKSKKSRPSPRASPRLDPGLQAAILREQKLAERAQVSLVIPAEDTACQTGRF